MQEDICRVNKGDRLDRGQRYGMIKLGSKSTFICLRPLNLQSSQQQGGGRRTVIGVVKDNEETRQEDGNIPISKIIPNMITSGSVFCGVASLIMTYHGHFVPAAVLICFAVFSM